MTNDSATPLTTTTVAEATTPAPFPADDPRASLARAVALASAVIGAVRPDQMALPTPCGDFDVRGLLAHSVSVLDRVAVIGRGGNVFEVPDRAGLVADDAWLDRWRQAAHAVQEAWSDDAVLARTVQVPWTTMSGADAAAIYTNEVTVHTWDLATATGQRPAWDPEVLEVCLASIHRELPDAERSAMWEQVAGQLPDPAGFIPPFGDAVPVADDAPAIDRLVAWNGRTPDAAGPRRGRRRRAGDGSGRQPPLTSCHHPRRRSHPRPHRRSRR